ncbi:MAG: methyltransferase domain-containing protein [Pseudomonadota bacterium]
MLSKNASIEFALSWSSDEACHRERLFLPRVDFWRDIFPGEMGPGLEAAAAGDALSADFAPGELLPVRDGQKVLDIRPDRFQRQYQHLTVEPRQGRYYPRGMIAGVAGIFPGEYRPFRVLEAGPEHLRVDLNHPLSGYPLSVSARIDEQLPSRDQHGGACRDIAEALTEKGPGLEALAAELRTDFFHDYPFARLDDNIDTVFYQMPRLVEHVDAVATREIGALYARLLQPDSRVLDLMSSWTSHLPEELPLAVSGLGLNEEELAENPRLEDWLIHDLNSDPGLPFRDGDFDAVICANSVEYLVRPREVLAEVARVLRPGGLAVLVFSERWFPPKVIGLWTEMHPFERMGLVLESLRSTGEFGDFHTESVRGYLRPDDDKYRGMTSNADPVYAVWARRAG